MSEKPINCPVCGDVHLKRAVLSEGLPALQCRACQGHWVVGADYFDWLDAKRQHPTASIGSNDQSVSELASSKTDSSAGKLCLDCGRYMRRVAVGYGQTFFLDRCTSCGGFWFDAKEWASLRASGMHREAHQIFTDAWQAEVRNQAREAADQRRLSDRLGAEGLARLEEIKQWVRTHPHGSEIIAALDQHERE